MVTARVVGQADPQDHRQHQHRDQAEDEHAGTGHPDAVTARNWTAAVVGL